METGELRFRASHTSSIPNSPRACGQGTIPVDQPPLPPTSARQQRPKYNFRPGPTAVRAAAVRTTGTQPNKVATVIPAVIGGDKNVTGGNGPEGDCNTYTQTLDGSRKPPLRASYLETT